MLLRTIPKEQNPMLSPDKLQQYIHELMAMDSQRHHAIIVQRWMIVTAIAYLIAVVIADSYMKAHHIGPIPNLPFMLLLALQIWLIMKRGDRIRQLDLDMFEMAHELTPVSELRQIPKPENTFVVLAHVIDERPRVVATLGMKPLTAYQFVQIMKRYEHEIVFGY